MFTRAGQDPGIKWEEKQTLEDAGISVEELEDAIENIQTSDVTDPFHQRTQEYKNEKAREGLESGKGGFRRG
jgi:hypothetical protein